MTYFEPVWTARRRPEIPAEAPANLKSTPPESPHNPQKGFCGFRGLPSYTLPGREAAQPCLRCRSECAEDELFCRAECFARWLLERAERRKLRAPSPVAARTAECPASAIPPQGVSQGEPHERRTRVHQPQGDVSPIPPPNVA